MNKKEITDAELIKALENVTKDEMAIFVMAEGRIRGALFNGTRFVNQMRLQQNTGILETMVLGQAALCGALMIPSMKGEEHLSLKYEIDGPAEGFSIEADSKGYVRGYLYNEHIPIEKPLENWNLAPFLGNGTMTVSRIHKEDKVPHISTVEVDFKNIAKDLAWYFRQSEQISTAFNTGIQFDKKGRVIGAGGMFLQVMPETGGKRGDGSGISSSSDRSKDDELLEKVELAFRTAPSLGQWFSEGGKIEDIVHGLFREFKPSIALKRDIIFDCPCNADYFLKYIKNLPASEIEDIKKSGLKELEVSCRNCGSVYKFPIDHF